MEEKKLPFFLKYIGGVAHGNAVSAVAVTGYPYYMMFSAGQGNVRVWDALAKPVTHLNGIEKESQIRTMKVSHDGNTLVVGGDFYGLSMYNVGTYPIRKTSKTLGESTSRALVISSDSKVCYSSDVDGQISVWDLHNRIMVNRFHGKIGGATCIDITNDGTALWTGGGDKYVRCWDIRNYKERSSRICQSKVFSLSCSPSGELVAVGMRNSTLAVMQSNMVDKYTTFVHNRSVRSLKFAHSGEWFLSTGDDKKMFGSFASEKRPALFEELNLSPTMCCDISADDVVIVDGAGDRATLYDVGFEVRNDDGDLEIF